MTVGSVLKATRALNLSFFEPPKTGPRLEHTREIITIGSAFRCFCFVVVIIIMVVSAVSGLKTSSQERVDVPLASAWTSNHRFQISSSSNVCHHCFQNSSSLIFIFFRCLSSLLLIFIFRRSSSVFLCLSLDVRHLLLMFAIFRCSSSNVCHLLMWVFKRSWTRIKENQQEINQIMRIGTVTVDNKRQQEASIPSSKNCRTYHHG